MVKRRNVLWLLLLPPAIPQTPTSMYLFPLGLSKQQRVDMYFKNVHFIFELYLHFDCSYCT